MKGICFIDDKLILLQTDQQGWDLPGGKLGYREPPTTTLCREFEEELGIVIREEGLIRATRRQMGQLIPISVVVLLYYCSTQATEADFCLSPEHSAYRLFTLQEVTELKLPPVYIEAIKACWVKSSDVM